jgi:predicted alpha/beta hydrolase family esterase
VAKQVLFIQGGGKGVHDEWDNKLVFSLRRELGPEYDVRYPRMPNEADPSYTLWKAALANEIADLDDDAALIGHSVGGTILINALAETPPSRQLAERLRRHVRGPAGIAEPVLIGEARRRR